MKLFSKNFSVASLPLIVLGTAFPVGFAWSAEPIPDQLNQLSAEVKQAAEWKYPETLVHLAGYADVGYVDAEGEPGTFSVGTFSPIFHYQFKDIVMLETELELELEEEGDTAIAAEYVAIDVFLGDYATLQVGKFLSPLGQFRQNLHPSWINKVASAPVGFGHDQAAPNADIGAQMRGGFPVGGATMNYAVYMANGPLFEGDFATGEIEMIETPGLAEDEADDKIAGGRLGLHMPSTKLEIGVSLATGKASVHYDPGAGVVVEPGRDYDVTGADLCWKIGSLEARAEYIKQEIGEDPASIAPEAVDWKAWYAQLAYRIGGTYELVVRQGKYTTPHPDMDREQTAVSANYLFSSNFIGKITHETNDNPNQGLDAADRWLAQLSYGF